MALATRGLSTIAIATALVGVLGLWALLGSTDHPLPGAAVPTDPAPAVPVAAPLRELPTERATVAAAVEPATTTASVRSYDVVYADLLATMHRGASLARQTPIDDGAFGTVQQRTNDLFAEMCTQVVDSGPRTVQKLLGFVNDWENRFVRQDLYCCQVILELRLKVLTDLPDGVAQRRELVAAMLDGMLVAEGLAEMVFRLLQHRSYVEPVHEPSLTALLGAATGELAHLKPMVMDLLLDLWLRMDDRNADLLALCEGQQGSETQRAALARLLCTTKYREFALDRIKASKDYVCMTDAAMLAARMLDGPTAIAIVQALKSTPEAELQPVGAYSVLAERFPEQLEASYEEALARGVMPAHRENALQALAFLPEGRGIDLARRAFESDGHARVRGVSLLALARLPTAEFASLFDIAVADAEFVGSTFGPDYLSGALRNHAPRCTDPNFLDRATNTLLAILPSGKVQVRGAIEALRGQYVPR
ncbi:MAG: hypothetical protein JNL08_20795 [Planctomycetes bacterium]|nr:hypothetical protein [Planctomycetota bacterium]